LHKCKEKTEVAREVISCNDTNVSNTLPILEEMDCHESANRELRRRGSRVGTMHKKMIFLANPLLSTIYPGYLPILLHLADFYEFNVLLQGDL
jgi:hypothetical protein